MSVSPQTINKMIAFLPQLVIAAITVIIFWLIARIIISIIHQFANKSSPERKPVFMVLATFSKVAIISVGIITALGSVGINVSALVASLGLGGLAITFATKDAFTNMLAGMTILVYQPFKIGEHIQVEELKGEVTKVDLRYTYLKEDGKVILIPNSNLLTHNITIMRS
ncbi:MAG: mechanosensitive ion channel family protein [Candidatus Berkiellales bacterium]